MSTKDHDAFELLQLTSSLGDSEDLVALLLNSTGEGIYGADLDGNCIFANPACLKLLGFKNDSEILGKNMHELVHHTRADGTAYPVEECNIYRAFWSREGSHIDDEIMWCSNGNSFSAEYWSFPVERDSELIGCVVTFTDITERLKIEDELRGTEQFVRLLLNSTGEGIYGTDLDGNCTFANPACVKLLGYEDDESLIGKNMHALVHHTRPNGEAYPVEECQIYTSFRQGEGTHVEDEVMWCSSGISFPAEYWSYPVERDGELVGSVVTFVDISERRSIEEELRQTEKMAALGKLSAGLAHELNNPSAAAGRAGGQLLEALDDLQLSMVEITKADISPDDWTAFMKWETEFRSNSEGASSLSPLDASDREDEIISWLEDRGNDSGWEMAPSLVTAGVRSEQLEEIAAILPSEALSPALAWWCKSHSARDLADVVTRSSRNISSIVDAVKSYSYMDQAPIQNVDIHQGIEDTITILGHKLQSGIKINRVYDRTLPELELRGSELNQVWTNLIDNSISAMGDVGTITIRTFQEGSSIVVEVGDDGPGIPGDVQSKIFDPFFTTKGVGEGTGLGLDVTRRIITGRCNGEIGVRSQPGETVFRVSLPITTQRLEEIET